MIDHRFALLRVPSAAPGRRRRNVDARRGITIVFVLGLIAITMVLSYSILRAQGTAVQIQQNSSRRSLARQAAESGLTIGLRKMHEADWGGVNSTFTGRISENDSYTVTYTPGDDRLQPGDADFAEYPYRVTVQSTGYSSNPSQPGATSTYLVEAVTVLSPRQLGATPPVWSEFLKYTVYQWTDDDFTLEVPSRVEGPVWVQGRMHMAEAYPSYSAARTRYLNDLRAMFQAGRPDYRPLNGPVSLRPSRQTAQTLTTLTSNLGLATITIPPQTAANWNPPAAPVTYQLFPGGKQYTVPVVGATLQNITLSADPVLNPLGLFYRASAIRVANNVTILGTLITQDDVTIQGTNVQLRAPELPALEGTSLPVRLPAIIVADDLRINDTARGNIVGSVVVWDELEMPAGNEAAHFSINGRVVTKEFAIRGRTQWTMSPLLWLLLHNSFASQLGDLVPILHFPTWLDLFGRHPQPLLTVTPPSAPVIDHWKEPQLPVYVAHPSDDGLRWRLVEWTENP